jgi:hypothetical protein
MWRFRFFPNGNGRFISEARVPLDRADSLRPGVVTRSIDPKFSLGQGGNDGRPVSRTTPSADKRIRPAGATMRLHQF